MAFPSDPNLHAYYEQGREQDRLEAPEGRLEFVRTQEILRRHLPPPGATIADVGGGPGSYSLWLAQEGYRLLLSDPIPLHIDQARASAADRGIELDAKVGDARALDVDDESVDAVLLLGPLYHLPERGDRIKALTEARRIARLGAPIFVAAISRWAPLLDGVVHRLYRAYPDATPLLDEEIASGVLKPLFPASFAGFCHRPEELVSESKEARLEFIDLVSVEGIGFAFSDLAERWADPVDRDAVLDAARRTERVAELLGLGPHLLLTARR
jgi:ubiquinone/menaquinone biosynthesis C-methylase UbiE